MKKGPEAVLFGPTPQDAQAASLRLRPTSAAAYILLPADASHDRFPRHFGQSASPSSGRCAKPILARGRAAS